MNHFHIQCESCKTWIALKLNMSKDEYREEVFDIKCPMCCCKQSFLVHPRQDEDIIPQKTNDLVLVRAKKAGSDYVITPMKSACAKEPKPFPSSMSDAFDVVDFGKGLREAKKGKPK